MDNHEDRSRATGDTRKLFLDLMAKVILNQINPENGARIKYLLDALTSSAPLRDRRALISALVDIRNQSPEISEALKDPFARPNWWIKTLGFPFSMIGPDRLDNVRWAVETVIAENIPGALIETGVWRGGACMMMKAVMTAYGELRDLYVCDSFQGLPEMKEGPDSSLPLNENPILAAPLDQVQSHFSRLDLLDDSVHFIEGWFADSMPQLRTNGPKQIAVLRLDGDYYHSTKVVLDNLYDRVVPGGIVIIDDYFVYEQCAKAVEEYRHLHGVTQELHQIDFAGAWWRV
ncbi:TylF/MycF family methyltransferase [Devosia sp. XJ19-1]|uniref:TylF/MycF family methyltransferase n=1 Tax=Devosia ureilytica TaxID=2952754 RepID=A0A9Q4FQK9_9HYPH|nr:TylF/MycF/NovP-related O-methyltransferase [Devosia ureilytica]MCP8883381.1 TylF/MycF family methyltransferase [Devosia ureilytica]MCP8886251.1 TylF/MycF family methyltransferase [Devosia ureilytica]